MNLIEENNRQLSNKGSLDVHERGIDNEFVIIGT